MCLKFIRKEYKGCFSGVMSRTIRIEYPGAWYHVINRSAGHKTIFQTAQHYQLFLELLLDAYSRFDIRIHAYCLMSNHYHLLIQTPLPNLGLAMKHINGLYTVRYNRLVEHEGALFRGRYKAILIDAENYLLQLSRYIHLRPVSVGITQFPELYPWSSYQYFLSEAKKPHWLCTREILSRFKDNPSELYQQFVRQGVASGLDEKMNDFIAMVKHTGILGSEFFSANIRDKMNQIWELEKIPGYCSSKRVVLPTVKDVIYVTATSFDVSISEIADVNKNRANFPRRVAMYLSYRITQQNRKTIAKQFGNVSSSAITKSCAKVEEIISSNEEIRMKIDSIRLSLY